MGFLKKKTREVILPFLGVAAAGGIFFPIDYNQTIAHIPYILDITKSSALIFADDFETLLPEINISSGEGRTVIIGKRQGRCYEWEEILVQYTCLAPEIHIEEDVTLYI